MLATVPFLVVEIVPVRVVETLPLRLSLSKAVVEMVPVLVVEMVPALVVEIVPVLARVVAETAITNIAAPTMGFIFFIALLLVTLWSRVSCRLKGLPAESFLSADQK